MTPKMVQKSQLSETSLRQDLGVKVSGEKTETEGYPETTFFVNTLVTFFTAQVSPVC